MTSATMSSGVMPSALLSPSYAPLPSAASMVHESSGRSCRNFVMMRVSATTVSCSVPMARSWQAGYHDARAASRSRTGDPEIVRATRLPALYSSIRLSAPLAGDRAVELVVHLQDGREVARGDALDLFDGDVAVGRVAPLQVVEEIGAAVHEAAHVGAHRDQELPDRLALEHRVEGARPQHERGCEVEQVGDLLDRLRRDVAVLVLREVQHGSTADFFCGYVAMVSRALVEGGRRERH